MASGGKRGGAGERVLESRHVIGLFMLMLLFSGVFFTLGYVMGRSQIDSPVNAATDFFKKPSIVSPKKDQTAKRAGNPAADAVPTDSSAPPNSDWEFYHAGDSKKPEDHLKSVVSPSAAAPARRIAPAAVKTTVSPRANGNSTKTTPPLPGGAYTLQVSALTKESDALELATRLQKKKFPAFVLSPQGDKYYRVQVGPYADPKAAEAARKGLEAAGFKPIVKH